MYQPVNEVRLQGFLVEAARPYISRSGQLSPREIYKLPLLSYPRYLVIYCSAPGHCVFDSTEGRSRGQEEKLQRISTIHFGRGSIMEHHRTFAR